MAKTKVVLKLKQGAKAPAVDALTMEARAILKRLQNVKALYERLDFLTLELMGRDLDGTGLEVVNNFATKNVSWKSCGIRQYELKLVEA